MHITWDSLVFLGVVIMLLVGTIYGLYSASGSEIGVHSSEQSYGGAELLRGSTRGTR
jgi:hypothetical protein